MTDQHPITPPPELVQQWKRTAPHQSNEHEHYHYITLCAAAWGADQELEACCRELEYNFMPDSGSLRAARRPKPPNLKEQALKTLEDAPGPDYPRAMTVLDSEQHALIRRALEALPND